MLQDDTAPQEIFLTCPLSNIIEKEEGAWPTAATLARSLRSVVVPCPVHLMTVAVVHERMI